MTQPPSNLNAFYPNLNSFCQKYLVKNSSSPPTPSDVKKLPALSMELESSLFEQFMLFNTVSIKVHGENVPLAWMIGRFGQRWLEEMIEQRAMKFVPWTPGILHNVTDIPGLHGIMAGNLSSPAHSDPEKSIDLGLNWLSKPATAQMRRLLRRKLAPLYYVPPKDIAQDTVQITTSAFNSGKLKNMGFDPNEKSIGYLSLPDRALLANCSNDLLEYRYLLSQQMTSLSEFKYFSFF
jgi:hypothetical protein